MTFDNEVGLGFGVLIRDGRPEAEALVDDGLEQRHVVEGFRRHFAVGCRDGGRHLGVQVAHELRPALRNVAGELREEDVEPTVGVEGDEEHEVGDSVAAFNP